MSRIIVIASAVFVSFIEVLLIVHHAVKIRLGDSQEGWSVSFVIGLVVSPLIIAYLIESARKIKD